MTFLELGLEPLQSQHLPQALDLDRLCLGGLWSLEGYRRELESPRSTLLALRIRGACSENMVGMGCFWAILEEAHLTLLAIHPDYQGRGFGQLLLLALLQDARQRGLERATLEVSANNAIALALYQKFGFKIAGRRQRYYPSGEDALILWRGDLARGEFAEQLQAWQQQIHHRLQKSQLTLRNKY
ncbi:MAG: ribosomal protein S18-alanine N-acetyltransferase [Chloroflexaceae bacterium]|nr:ribosomal protein S18-alanine N-acetyltransferase [Chloroflexaceae bacterium]